MVRMPIARISRSAPRASLRMRSRKPSIATTLPSMARYSGVAADAAMLSAARRASSSIATPRLCIRRALPSAISLPIERRRQTHRRVLLDRIRQRAA